MASPPRLDGISPKTWQEKTGEACSLLGRGSGSIYVSDVVGGWPQVRDRRIEFSV